MPAPRAPAPETAERLRRLMGDALDEQIAAAAVASGRITAAQLEEARRAQDEARGGPPRLTAILRDRGLLDAAAAAELEARVAADAFVRPAARLEPPDEVRAAAADPARGLGPFVLVEAIGLGATGEVWRAWDPRLQRFVAVKISTAAPASGSARERFEREALAAGRLRHPGLVPVHEVGVDRGRAYLVMPLVEGETLERLRLPVRRALEVIRAAALAIAHAHAQGIVHRDLKPANVMVDREGHVHVLDFGLVWLREDGASGLTQPGDVLGTAGYMSPEQARGDPEARGPATDVYGLGATLYHAVTGQPPFASVVERVIRDEPQPPRQIAPDLDPRVEAVILRALAKDPGRRYPSAAALAEELARLLAGEEVHARPAGRAARLAALVRRRRHAVALGAALALAAAAGIGASVRVSAERRSAIETLRQMARVSLETALALRRAGDLAGMRRLRPALVAAYEAARARGAETAEVEHLVGRMYRALLEDERALEHQERALARDPDLAAALYERAVLLSARFGRALDEAEAELRARDGDRAAAAGSARPELAVLRERIRRDLERLREVGAARAEAEAAAGILAYHERRWDEARARLAAAVADSPLREEAWQALARATEGARRLSEAEEIYGRALARDRGYLPHALGRCALRRRLGRNAEAIEDATAVLALEPASVEALLCRGGARTRVAHDRIQSGEDPTRGLDEAQADFDRALAVAPRAAAAHAGRAVAHRYRAIFAERRGADPRPHLEAAERDADRAIALEPAGAGHRASRARTRTRRGMHAQLEGGDPRADFAAAEADYAEAIRADRSRPELWAWRAELRAYRGLDRAARGEPPDADFAAAEEDLAASIRLYGGDPLSYLKRGELAAWRGQALARAGGDPEPLWARAEADLDRAARGLPRSAEAHAARARLLTERGIARARRRSASDRAAAAADFAAAAAALDQALAADPRYAEAFAALARLRGARGDRAGAAEDRRRAVALKPRLEPALARGLAGLGPVPAP